MLKNKKRNLLKKHLGVGTSYACWPNWCLIDSVGLNRLYLKVLSVKLFLYLMNGLCVFLFYFIYIFNIIDYVLFPFLSYGVVFVLSMM